jgi:hypothetical protein
LTTTSSTTNPDDDIIFVESLDALNSKLSQLFQYKPIVLNTNQQKQAVAVLRCASAKGRPMGEVAKQLVWQWNKEFEEEDQRKMDVKRELGVIEEKEEEKEEEEKVKEKEGEGENEGMEGKTVSLTTLRKRNNVPSVADVIVWIYKYFFLFFFCCCCDYTYLLFLFFFSLLFSSFLFFPFFFRIIWTGTSV